MLRRTRIEVKRELPPVTVVPHHIDADPKVLDLLNGQAIELAKLILKQTQDFKGQKMQASGEFNMKMRQVTGIAKAPYVAEFVKFLVEDNDEPVVVYAWHREVYDILMERLKDLNPVMYTGSESPAQKEAAKQAFINKKSKVMLISLRAGAGMDGLQDVCHLAVFAELDWSPGVHEQCVGRVHRDGQDEPVTVYYLLSEHGSDPVMSDILGIKKQQIEGVRDPNQDLVTKLQVEEDYIKQMAQKFLTDHGIELPPEAPKDEVTLND
jgi:SNF2 family DNA or RNA helicase